MSARDDRAHDGLRLQRVAQHHRRRGLEDEVQDAVVHRGLDEQPGRQRTPLPRHVQGPARRRTGRRLDIGVGKDDVRRLAAELERNRLGSLRGRRLDPARSTDSPGEAHLPHELVADEVIARNRVTVHDVDDARREADVQRALGEAQRAEGRELTRLDHHRVPGGECSARLTTERRETTVPRHDEGDDPVRLGDHVVEPTGRVDGDELALGRRRQAAVVVEEIAATLGERPREAQWKSGLEREEGRVVVCGLTDPVGECDQQLVSTNRRRVAPYRGCAGRGADRGVDVVAIGERDLGLHLAGRRIHMLDRTRSALRLPRVTDEEPRFGQQRGGAVGMDLQVHAHDGPLTCLGGLAHSGGSEASGLRRCVDRSPLRSGSMRRSSNHHVPSIFRNRSWYRPAITGRIAPSPWCSAAK